MIPVELNHYVMVESLRYIRLPLAAWDSTVQLSKDNGEWVASWVLRWDPDGEIPSDEEVPSPVAMYDLLLKILDCSFGLTIRYLELLVELETRNLDAETKERFIKEGFRRINFYDIDVVADESSLETLRKLGFSEVERVTCSIQKVSAADPALGTRKWDEFVFVTEDHETYRKYSDLLSPDSRARELQQPAAFISRLTNQYQELY